MTPERKAAAISADLAYIRQYWSLLAAEAWQGYCTCGRGVLLINLESGISPLASYHTALGGPHQGWFSARLAAQVRRYDPSSEIIVLMMRDSREVLTYCLEAKALPPPQAYQRLRASISVAAA